MSLLEDSQFNNVYVKYINSGCKKSIYSFAVEHLKSEELAKECKKNWKAIRRELVAESRDKLLDEMAILINDKNKCFASLTDSNLQRLSKIETLIKNKKIELKGLSSKGQGLRPKSKSEISYDEPKSVKGEL